MHDFPSPHERIRRVLESAFPVGCVYVSAQPEDGGNVLALRARRGDGREVGVRFRGVRDSSSGQGPESGLPISVRSVKREGGSLLGRVFPLLKPPGPAYARVRIDVGTAVLEIVCQDAEWWEE